MSRLGHSTAAASLRYQKATSERDALIAERVGELAAGVALRLVNE
jgi:hypothetical protein